MGGGIKSNQAFPLPGGNNIGGGQGSSLPNSPPPTSDLNIQKPPGGPSVVKGVGSPYPSISDIAKARRGSL